MYSPEKIAERLIFLRKKTGLKKSEFCRKYSFSEAHYYKWESGKTLTGSEFLNSVIELCLIHDVSADFLLFGIE